MADMKPLPVTPGSADVDLEELKWMLIWDKHHKSIIGGLVALVILAIAAGIYAYAVHQRATAAAAAFADAADTKGWQEVVSDYPGSIPAGNALFLIAQAQRSDGKLDESTATYRVILEKYPKHPLVAEAALGIASNLADAGKVDEADQAYQQAAATYGSTFVAPLALFAEAHLLLAQGKQAEALPVLENITAQYPDSFLSNASTALAEQMRSLAPEGASLATQAPPAAP